METNGDNKAQLQTSQESGNLELHPWRDVFQEEKFRQEYAASHSAGQAEDESDSGSDDTDGQEWRSKHSQQQYRKHYKAVHPEEDISQKDVAHVVSLEIAQHIKHEYRLQLDDKEMKRCLNVADNLKMVNRETNRVQHHEIDHALMSADRHASLSQAQIQRARQQVRVLEKCEFPPTFQAAALQYYRRSGV